MVKDRARITGRVTMPDGSEDYADAWRISELAARLDDDQREAERLAVQAAAAYRESDRKLALVELRRLHGLLRAAESAQWAKVQVVGMQANAEQLRLDALLDRLSEYQAAPSVAQDRAAERDARLDALARMADEPGRQAIEAQVSEARSASLTAEGALAEAQAGLEDVRRGVGQLAASVVVVGDDGGDWAADSLARDTAAYTRRVRRMAVELAEADGAPERDQARAEIERLALRLHLDRKFVSQWQAREVEAANASGTIYAPGLISAREAAGMPSAHANLADAGGMVESPGMGTDGIQIWPGVIPGRTAAGEE
jgi:hypothetical protein